MFFFFSSRRRHTRWPRDWSSDVCSSDLAALLPAILYYIALFLMIHFEAIRLDLPRADETQIPRVSDVLKRGWFYFIPVLVLITLLLSGYSPSRTGFFGIISIIIISWFQPKKRMKIGEIIQALAEGAKTAIPISSACAAAGLVIAGIMTTGLGGKLSSIILNITSGQLLPSLLRSEERRVGKECGYKWWPQQCR